VSAFSIPRTLDSTTPVTFVVLVGCVASVFVPTLNGRVNMIAVILCLFQTGWLNFDRMQGMPWNNKQSTHLPCVIGIINLCLHAGLFHAINRMTNREYGVWVVQPEPGHDIHDNSAGFRGMCAHLLVIYCMGHLNVPVLVFPSYRLVLAYLLHR
jgi:hypothetical protein